MCVCRKFSNFYVHMILVTFLFEYRLYLCSIIAAANLLLEDQAQQDILLGVFSEERPPNILVVICKVYLPLLLLPFV